MNQRLRSAVKVMARDARMSLNQHSNISLASGNYGLSPTRDVLEELARQLPTARIESTGMFGYIKFERREQ